ncbi:MAG: hypothetical protein H0V64_02505 [Geodermatophilaceae bacterium]|nr:hypothetical protein [Geodermatophilaceae bacterium]MDQ3463431.1 fructose-bisphosphate aldolase [Actinomycetota bacterium]
MTALASTAAQLVATGRGDPERVGEGQAALAHQVRCNSAALDGTYTSTLEKEPVSQ